MKQESRLLTEVEIDAAQYYSNAEIGLSTTGPAEEVKIENGVGCSSTSFLTYPLEIGDDDITVNETVEEVTSTDGDES